MASHARLNSFSKPRKGFSSCFRTYTTARMSRAPSGIPIEGKSQKKPREPTQQCSLESIWLRSNAFHNVCMNICTMYTIRNCLYLPRKRPYMLHRKRVRAEIISISLFEKWRKLAILKVPSFDFSRFPGILERGEPSRPGKKLGNCGII